MNILTYTVDFVYKQLLTADCSEFIGWAKHLQIHVCVKVSGKQKCFNFYKCPDELFWFELMPDDEKFAFSIASVLGKQFNLRVVKRNGLIVEP